MAPVVTSKSEVAAELERLLPAALEEKDVNATVDAFLTYLGRLTKREHVALLGMLARRMEFRKLRTIVRYTSWGGMSNAGQDLFDLFARTAIVTFVRHETAYHILAHILMRLRAAPGKGIRRLVHRMSRRERNGLFARLIEIDEASGEDRYGLPAEIEQTLLTQFGYVRLGYLDYALTKLIEAYDARIEARNGSPEAFLERYVLGSIRDARRKDASRLPEVKSAASARFVLEEADRELRFYSARDTAKAIALLDDVYAWWSGSKARQRIAGRPIYLELGRFFDEVWTARHRLRSGSSWENPWKSYNVGFLYDDRFWHNLAGLNGDVAFESTESARREAAYRRGAVVGPAILAAPVLLLVVLRVAISVPGAVAGLIRWVGGKLLLATQYAVATYRVYGVVAGTGVMVRDAYVFYLVNPVVVNTVLTQGSELVLELVAGDSGMAPGSSPADRVAGGLAKVPVQGRDVARVASDLIGMRRRAEAEVALIEVPVTDATGTTYRVIGKVTGYDGGKPKIDVVGTPAVIADLNDASKKVVFYSGVGGGGDEVLEQSLRTAGVDLTPSTGATSHGVLLTKPKRTVVGGKSVKSWHPAVLVGTTEDQMKRAALRIIGNTPGHPLEGALVNGRFLSGGNKKAWNADARYLEAAHVLSKKVGGANIIVLMSAKYNRKYSADLERPGSASAVLLDEVLDIGGIAVHKRTARDLVDQGRLDASALDGAKTVDLQNIELPASNPATAARGLGNTGTQAKGTARAGKSTQRAKQLGGRTPSANQLLAKPAMTRIAGLRVKSWHPKTLVGTSQSQMRAASERVMNQRGNPLARLLVDGRLQSGGYKELWASDARYLVAAHVLSKKAGGDDIIVLMSASRNSRFSGDLEIRGTPGAVALDEVYSIGNVAIHKSTVHDLIDQRWLDRSVLDDAENIDLRDIAIPP